MPTETAKYVKTVLQTTKYLYFGLFMAQAVALRITHGFAFLDGSASFVRTAQCSVANVNYSAQQVGVLATVAPDFVQMLTILDFPIITLK